MERFETNGDKEYKLHCSENDRYAMFYPEDLLDLGPQYYAHLRNAFTEWIKKHPDRRIRNTLPICDKSGQTVILSYMFGGIDLCKAKRKGSIVVFRLVVV